MVLWLAGCSSTDAALTAQPTAKALGHFELAGSLSVPREDPMTIRLDDGRVMIAGGRREYVSPTASVEIFDPASGELAPSFSLGTPRADAAGALLTDGRVLFVGGQDAESWADNVEIVDPMTGDRSQHDGLFERDSHSATLLDSGEVLVVGGNSPTLTDCSEGNTLWLRCADLVDPATGESRPAAMLARARRSHQAVRLDDGRVLVVGGWPIRDVGGAELYDPALEAFVPAAEPLVDRVWHSATLLQDGRVLVVGGTNSDGDFVPLAELYDPSTDRWELAGELHTPRIGHAATLLADGRVLVVGGRVRSGSANRFLRSTEVYDPASREWSAGPELVLARYHHSAITLDDGRVLVVAGYGDGGKLAPAELLVDDAGTRD
jgi:hypothetical protein